MIAITKQLVSFSPVTITDQPALLNDSIKAFNKCVARLPRNFAIQMAAGFSEKYNQYGIITAFKYLRERTGRASQVLKQYPLPIKALYREETRKELGLNAANECYEMLIQDVAGDREYIDKLTDKYKALSHVATGFKISPPAINPEIPETIETALMRLTCSKWWARKFERQAKYSRELTQIAAKRVNKKCPYISLDGLQEFRAKVKAGQDYLEAFEVFCEETGQVQLLADVAAKTTSNPQNRLNELMVRLAGMEEIAKEKGQEAFFITWTAPSKWHGASNKWNLANPKESQSFLCNQWAKARAKLARKDVQFSGARITEPHKDGTPHWHILVFVKKDQSKQMLDILRDYATQPDNAELIARAEARKKQGKPLEAFGKVRFDVEAIDPSKGSAVAYITKYISKNINATGVKNEPDYDSELTLERASERVRGWASKWDVRQFQFFGAAKISVYRELRRIKNPLLDDALEQIRLAADGAKWGQFQTLCGSQQVSLEYETNPEAGEYGDDVKTITGVNFNDVPFVTRFLKWVSRKSGSNASMEDGSPSWSSVNNCTEQSKSDLQNIKKLGYRENHAGILASGGKLTFDGVIYHQIIDNKLRQFTK